MKGMSGTMEQLAALCREYGEMSVLNVINIVAQRLEAPCRICAECCEVFPVSSPGDVWLDDRGVLCPACTLAEYRKIQDRKEVGP